MNTRQWIASVPTTAIHAIGATLCVAIIAGALLIGLVPMQRARSAERAERAQAASLDDQLRRAGEAFSGLDRQVESLRAAIEARGISLTPESRLNQRLAELTSMLVDRGLAVQTLQPGEKEPGGANGVVPIRLDMIGTLDRIVALLGELDETQPDLHIDAISLEHAGPENVRLRASVRWLLGVEDASDKKTST